MSYIQGLARVSRLILRLSLPEAIFASLHDPDGDTKFQLTTRKHHGGGCEHHRRNPDQRQHHEPVLALPQEADRVIQQLKSLNTILEGLVDLLQKENGLDDDLRFRAIHTLQASGQLDAFLAVLKELEEKFTLSRGWDKLISPLKSKELEDAIKEIDRFKSTASLALNVHHAARLQLVDEKANAVSEMQNSTEEGESSRMSK